MLSPMQAQQISQIKNTMNLMRSARNPQAIMMQMVQNNPMYAQAMNIAQQFKGDPKEAFYKKAQEMGVDPDEVMSYLR